MRSIRFFMIFHLVSMKLLSQQIVIEKQNDLIANTHNSMKVLIENCDCTKVHIYSSSSNVKKKDNCVFTIFPQKGEKTLLAIYKKEDNDSTLIGTRKFRIKNDFEYKAILERRALNFSDSIFISSTKDFDYQISAYPLKQMCYKYYTKNIKEFTLIIIKKNGSMFLNKNIGYSYDMKSKKILNALEVDDKIIFTDIILKSPFTKENIKLKPLNIKVTADN